MILTKLFKLFKLFNGSLGHWVEKLFTNIVTNSKATDNNKATRNQKPEVTQSDSPSDQYLNPSEPEAREGNPGQL